MSAGPAEPLFQGSDSMAGHVAVLGGCNAPGGTEAFPGGCRHPSSQTLAYPLAGRAVARPPPPRPGHDDVMRQEHKDRKKGGAAPLLHPGERMNREAGGRASYTGSSQVSSGVLVGADLPHDLQAVRGEQVTQLSSCPGCLVSP